MNISYVNDVDGNQTAVIVDIKDWTKLLEKQQKMKEKISVLSSLREAVQEVNSIKKSGDKKRTLKEFLNAN